MNYYMTSELYHHGIKGQKWGVRRYQNPDGTLTAAGRQRYGSEELYNSKKNYKEANREYSKAYGKAWFLNAPHSVSKKRRAATKKRWEDVEKKAEIADAAKKAYKTTKGNAKLEKSVSKVYKERDKTLSAREANKAKLDAKLQKKVDAGKITKEKANERKQDFDLGTRAVKKGYDRYATVLSDYKKMKISSINDPSIKKSAEYKAAGKAYKKQVLSDYYSSMPVTVLSYASEAAIDELAKKK